MRRSSLFWGAILVLIGAILLLDNLNILRINIWGIIWPLFLIALGAWIVFGVMSGKTAKHSLEVESASIPIEGTDQADITIRHGAGRLVVNNQVTTGSLVSGKFGGGLELTRQANGNGSRLDLRPKGGKQAFWDFPWSWGSHDGYDWEVALNPDVPLVMRLETGADDARIDLTDLRVTELRLHTGASSTDLTLPAHVPNTLVKVDGGAASLKLRVPGGVAAQIRTHMGVSSVSIDETRFPRTGDVFQSPEFATAANKVDIEIRMGAGSVNVS